MAHDSVPLFSLQADLNSTIQDGPGTFYGVSSQYSSAENMTITVSTKVCSFGKQVVEKVEVSAVWCWGYLGMVSMLRVLGQCGMDKTLEANVGRVGTGCGYPTVSLLAATCILHYRVILPLMPGCHCRQSTRGWRTAALSTASTAPPCVNT